MIPLTCRCSSTHAHRLASELTHCNFRIPTSKRNDFFCNYKKFKDSEKKNKRKSESDPYLTYIMLENSLEKKRINGLLYGHFVVTDHSAAVRKREARDAAANCGVLGGKYTKNDKGGYSSHWSPHRMEEPEKCVFHGLSHVRFKKYKG